MKIPRVYVNEPLHVGTDIGLNKDVFKYLVRVLRRAQGDAIELFNGDGFNYHATLKLASPSSAAAEIQAKKKNTSESPLHINLVQSLAKGTKLDLVVQKATELGVNQITPVISERSVMQIDNDRIDRKLAHWQGVAVSAATQCQRSLVPVIERPLSLLEWIEKYAIPASCLLLHPSAKKTLKDVDLPSSACSLLVGPEGGFTEAEIKHAVTRGAIPFQCGPRVLRTETAGFTAIAILQSLFGDL